MMRCSCASLELLCSSGALMLLRSSYASYDLLCSSGALILRRSVHATVLRCCYAPEALICFSEALMLLTRSYTSQELLCSSGAVLLSLSIHTYTLWCMVVQSRGTKEGEHPPSRPWDGLTLTSMTPRWLIKWIYSDGDLITILLTIMWLHNYY